MVRDDLGLPNAKLGSFVGRAGELRVASELLLRGINVASYEVDNDGVDLITIPLGKKIQVKTSRREFTGHGKRDNHRYPAYLFCTRRKKYVNSRNVTLRPKIKAENIDFLICWCVDHDWFYIIPSSEMTQTSVNIPINQTKPSKYQKFLNAWDLIKEK